MNSFDVFVIKGFTVKIREIKSVTFSYLCKGQNLYRKKGLGWRNYRGIIHHRWLKKFIRLDCAYWIFISNCRYLYSLTRFTRHSSTGESFYFMYLFVKKFTTYET